MFPDAEGNPQEHPIHRFIAFAQPKKVEGLPQPKIEPKPFYDSFLFAGSHLVNDGANPKKYLCEQSGNIISISTFGDERFVWRNNTDTKTTGSSGGEFKGLPAVGTAVILRLRPKPKASRKPQNIPRQLMLALGLICTLSVVGADSFTRSHTVFSRPGRTRRNRYRPLNASDR